MAAKIRRDAKLKGLPAERQDEVIRIATEHGISKETLARIQSELKIDVRSLKTLSEFWHWWHHPMQRMSRELATAGSITSLVIEQMRRKQPDVSEEELFAYGQRVFAERAIAMQDVDAWTSTQSAQRDKERVKLKGAEVQLAREKFERETCELILKAVRDERVRAIESSGVPHEEKIRELRAHYFQDVDELEKAGGVELPA